MSLLLACALDLLLPHTPTPSQLSSVSVIHRGVMLLSPVSHLTTASETPVFTRETAYFVLLCGDIFMRVQLSGE